MCGRRYLLKIKMVCGISRPTCSSSVWIGCIFIKKEAPFPLPLGLGGRSNGAWPPIKVRKSQEASLGASIFLQHLLSACSFSESSPHRAQATQRVHMSVPLSRVPASLSHPSWAANMWVKKLPGDFNPKPSECSQLRPQPLHSRYKMSPLSCV